MTGLVMLKCKHRLDIYICKVNEKYKTFVEKQNMTHQNLTPLHLVAHRLAYRLYIQSWVIQEDATSTVCHANFLKYNLVSPQPLTPPSPLQPPFHHTPLSPIPYSGSVTEILKSICFNCGSKNPPENVQ